MGLNGADMVSNQEVKVSRKTNSTNNKSTLDTIIDTGVIGDTQTSPKNNMTKMNLRKKKITTHDDRTSAKNTIPSDHGVTAELTENADITNLKQKSPE